MTTLELVFSILFFILIVFTISFVIVISKLKEELYSLELQVKFIGLKVYKIINNEKNWNEIFQELNDRFMYSSNTYSEAYDRLQSFLEKKKSFSLYPNLNMYYVNEISKWNVKVAHYYIGTFETRLECLVFLYWMYSSFKDEDMLIFNNEGNIFGYDSYTKRLANYFNNKREYINVSSYEEAYRVKKEFINKKLDEKLETIISMIENEELLKDI